MTGTRSGAVRAFILAGAQGQPGRECECLSFGGKSGLPFGFLQHRVHVKLHGLRQAGAATTSNQVTSSNTYSMSYRWDAADNLRTMTLPSTRTPSWNYDSAGNQATPGSVAMSYDEESRMTTTLQSIVGHAKPGRERPEPLLRI